MKDKNVYDTKDGERISMPYKEYIKSQIYWIILTFCSLGLGIFIGNVITTELL